MIFPKIIDVLPQMKTGTGFFSSFNNPMWAETFPDTQSLDIYFAGTYGQKFISPYLDMFRGTDGKISDSDLEDIAATIYQIHAKQWAHLYADLLAQYDPIENTDAYESTTETRNISGTSANTRTLNTSTNANMGTNTQQSQAATTTSNSQTTADTGTIGDTGNTATAETFSRTYHKHGNIGTMTASQLLTGDLELWQWSFIKQICDDILYHI